MAPQGGAKLDQETRKFKKEETDRKDDNIQKRKKKRSTGQLTKYSNPGDPRKLWFALYVKRKKDPLIPEELNTHISSVAHNLTRGLYSHPILLEKS